MNKKIRVLTVIDGLGFGGGESRILSMGQGLDRDRFTHSVLALNSSCYSAREEFEARRAQYTKAGVMVDDLTEVGARAPFAVRWAASEALHKNRNRKAGAKVGETAPGSGR